MSKNKNMTESERWLKTAEDDLSAANILHENGKFAQACFFSQQAAEKAVKSIYFRKDFEPWGHSVKKLITSLSSLDKALYNRLKLLEDNAAILDRFYIPTRYPNGLPDIIPSEAYSNHDAKSAIDISAKIIDGIKSCLD